MSMNNKTLRNKQLGPWWVLIIQIPSVKTITQQSKHHVHEKTLYNILSHVLDNNKKKWQLNMSAKKM